MNNELERALQWARSQLKRPSYTPWERLIVDNRDALADRVLDLEARLAEADRLLCEARGHAVALLTVLRDASSHLPPKAPIDMPAANKATSDVVDWIARIDALRATDSAPAVHYPVEFGPSDSRQLHCACGNPDPFHADSASLSPAELSKSNSAPRETHKASGEQE